MNSEQGYFCLIPAWLLEKGDLTLAALYGVITSLTKREGYCYASNKYLAERLGRKEGETVSRKMKELKKLGLIEIEIDQITGNKRKIWILSEKNTKPIQKNFDTYQKKTQDPYPKKFCQHKEIDSSSTKSKENCAADAALSSKMTKRFLEIVKLPRPDGDYETDNIWPARSIAKYIREGLTEQGVPEAEQTDERILLALERILKNMDDFHQKNCTSLKYLKYNFNKIINTI